MSDLDLLADLVRIGETAAELSELVKRRDDLAKEHASIGDELTALEADIEVRWGLLPHRTAIKITPSAMTNPAGDPMRCSPDQPCSACQPAPLTDASLSTAVDRAAEAKIARAWEPPADASPVMKKEENFTCPKCGQEYIGYFGGYCQPCAADEPNTDPDDAELTAMGLEASLAQITARHVAKQSRRDLPIPGPKPEPGPPMDDFIIYTGTKKNPNSVYTIRCHGLKVAQEYAKAHPYSGMPTFAKPNEGEIAYLTLKETIEPTQPVAIGELRLAK